MSKFKLKILHDTSQRVVSRSAGATYIRAALRGVNSGGYYDDATHVGDVGLYAAGKGAQFSEIWVSDLDDRV